MLWRGRRRSANVEDIRGGGGRKIAVAGGGLGAIVIALVILFLGGNPEDVVQVLQPQQGQLLEAPGSGESLSQQEREAGEFVAVVLADTEDVWNALFRQQGANYREPRLVLFSGYTRSECGGASASVGPFYCPADEKVYIDLVFLEEMQRRLNAPGDFAAAYVIAHEVGHHVQKLLGIMDQVQEARAGMSEEEYNRLSVRLELQADFFAGVWAHHAQRTKHILEEGDIEEGMNAASAVGDDRIQRQSQGYVVPDAFTHGTSEQRLRWFLKGFRTGDLSQGDTFAASPL
ncbi:MAG: neutral zinc metallopeptidase [Acidobacteriota bacterium]